MSLGSLPRRFYAVAVCAGIATGNFWVGIPLFASGSGRPASFAGALLAAATVATALGALAANPLLARLRLPRELLAVALAVTGAGHFLLIVPATFGLVGGALVAGVAMGLFWVGSHVMLSTRSGSSGSEQDFLTHYALFTAGAVAGAALTGFGASAVQWAGISQAASVRLSFALGLTGAIAALLLWLPCVACGREAAPVMERLTLGLPARGFAVQFPDLLLVSAHGFMLPLAPLVLADDFGFSPFAIGLVAAAVSVAKIGGVFTARAVVRSSGARTTILSFLAIASALSLFLGVAGSAALFVLALLGIALVALGVWPLIVDAALARIEPDSRGGVTVAWHAREYAVIALATALAGWLLQSVGDPTPLFVIAALLLGLSVAASTAVLRRPVHLPQASTACEACP